MSYYRFILNLVGGILKVIWRPQYIGRENFPKEGPVVLCSNHINSLDPFLIAYGLKREVYFLAKEELFRNPIMRHLLIRGGMIPVKRGQSDRQAIRRVLKELNEGKVIGIFPEGTRSKGQELLSFHEGPVYFAMKAGASLLPTAVVGDYSLRKPMRIVYGTVIPVEKAEKTDRDLMHQLTKELSEEIQRLKGEAHGD